MNNISFEFAHPWFLLVLVVAIPLALIPFFRLKKARRRSRNKITSLVLHLIIVLLCTLVLSGFTIKSEDSLKKKETFIVVDVSRSVNNQAEDIDAFVDNILKDIDGNNRVGIVTFSDGAMVASQLSSNAGSALSALKNARKQGAGKATDINQALTFTAKQFTNKKNAKIVLITDGIDTENNLIIHSSNTTEDVYEYTDNKIVLETVRGIASQGISVDTAYFEPVRYDKDMQINSVIFEKNVLPTQLIPVKVTVQSQVPAPSVTLKLFDRLGENGPWEEKGTITPSIQKGLNQDLTFENFSFGKSGLHTLKVELSGYIGEQIAENNVYYSYVNIEENKSILIIDGDGKQAANMQALINGTGYTAKVVSPANAPKGNDLASFNEVILMNVHVNELPKGYDKELDTYVSKFGGGLFTTGGDKTYYYGGMDGTRFDTMLPVNVIPEDNSVNAIMFVIDSSGSMYYDFNKGGSSDSDCFYDETSKGFQNTPMYYIKEGLKEAAVSIFAKKDYLGVMHFGKKDKVTGEPYKIDLQLTKASQRGAFVNAINGIKSIKGTNWSIPLQAAANHLKETGHKVDKKQIIFITDGSRSNLEKDANTDFEKLTKDFKENWEITTSVIAVNSAGSGAAVDLMEAITTAVDEKGNKRFYNCNTTTQFIKALADECKAASTDTMNEGGNYEVEIAPAAAKSSLFEGIAVDGMEYPQKGIMPNIPQYNGVTVKADKDVEALISADNVANGTHDALYAQWSYGKGRVGSFASDLGSWAKDFYTDPEAKDFLENVVRGLLREGEFKSTMWVDYEKKNFTTEIYVNGDLTDNKAVFIDVTEPDGTFTRYNDALRVVGNERCTTSIHTNKEGLYKIHVEKEDASGAVVEQDDFYFTFSYSQEYNTFIEETASLQDFLSEVSVVGNGNVLSLSDFEYNHSLDYVTVVYDPKMIFSLISAILFILDIAARKFNFKWPHEWFMKKKEEEA